MCSGGCEFESRLLLSCSLSTRLTFRKSLEIKIAEQGEEKNDNKTDQLVSSLHFLGKSLDFDKEL